MAYEQRLIDLEKFPKEVKPEVKHMAQQFNAFVGDVGDIRTELDRVTGQTQEEKEEMFGFFARVRSLFLYLHGKRFNITLLSVQASIAVWLLKAVGVPLDQVGRLLEAVIKLVEKMAV